MNCRENKEENVKIKQQKNKQEKQEKNTRTKKEKEGSEEKGQQEEKSSEMIDIILTRSSAYLTTKNKNIIYSYIII